MFSTTSIWSYQPQTASPDTFWNDLDPDIIRVAQEKFEDGHFRDAALSALLRSTTMLNKLFSRKTDRSWMGLN